jgi:hypothetical protein
MFLMEVTPVSIGDVLTNLSSVFTWLTGNVGNVFTLIQTYPIAMVPIGIALGFSAVRFTKYILGI